jgi:hypothetical protein
VLAANATNAVVGGVLCCLLGPVAFLLFVAIGTDTVTAVDVGGTVMVIAGVTGFGVGIRPVLYHWWLRRRLTAEDKLPAELRRFLDWAAKPPREWLRVADGYEFRHRELLDHLANGKVSRGNARR